MNTAAAISTSLSRVDREGFAAFMLRMRTASIDDRALMDAIEQTPRRQFVEPQYHNAVWQSRMIPIECGQVIEGLDAQALIIHRLQISKPHRILEIGTGSGYTAAVMGRLATRVTSLERYKTLAHHAQGRMKQLDLSNVLVSQADGAGGSQDGPFDRIVSWCAFEAVPRPFIDQLVSGGCMICPIGHADEAQILAKMTKVGSRFEREDIGTIRAQLVQQGMPRVL